MNRIIDFRSDTLTLPTEEMYKEMAKAEIGDDVFGEDKSINRLEKYAAETMGKEAALFVPSGTMGNLIAVMAHTQSRKCEIIVEETSHIYINEAGGYAHIAGVAAKALRGLNGALPIPELRKAITLDENVHHPRTALICMENTHNASGGSAVPVENISAVREVARKYNIPMHLDGARIFNSAIALGVKAKDIADYFDSVMFCLSKGLSAPVGSVLAGTKEFIKEARAMRKLLGGGMRQAGILAAAGYVALSKMTERLEEDHEVAKALGRGLSQIEKLELVNQVQTNMVKLNTEKLNVPAETFTDRLAQKGILALATEEYAVRFVTNRHVRKEDIEEVLSRISGIVDELK